MPSCLRSSSHSPGIHRAIRFLFYPKAIFRGDQLERAVASGAVCTYIEARHYHDSTRDGWAAKRFKGYLRQIAFDRKIHGYVSVPSRYERRWRNDYRLVEVPREAPLARYQHSDSCLPYETLQLSYERNVPKILIGLLQALFGGFTLYQTRGDQRELYGYSAFGLSAAPYVIMSLVNSIAALAKPHYPVIYLVNSPDMNHARGDVKAEFYGVVAAIDEQNSSDPVHSVELDATPRRYLLTMFVASAIPLILVETLTGFQRGTKSTVADRGWIASWIVVGAFSWPWVQFTTQGLAHDLSFKGKKRVILLLVILQLPLWIPAMGGMYTVSKMLGDYGMCRVLSL